MMFTVNVPELKGRMAARGKNIAGLSREMGISRNTLSHYLKNPSNITYSTINQIATILDMEAGEAQTIFFNTNLTLTQDLKRPNV